MELYNILTLFKCWSVSGAPLHFLPTLNFFILCFLHRICAHRFFSWHDAPRKYGLGKVIFSRQLSTCNFLGLHSEKVCHSKLANHYFKLEYTWGVKGQILIHYMGGAWGSEFKARSHVLLMPLASSLPHTLRNKYSLIVVGSLKSC